MFLAIYRLHVHMYFDFLFENTLAFEFDRKHYLSVYFY